MLEVPISKFNYLDKELSLSKRKKYYKEIVDDYSVAREYDSNRMLNNVSNSYDSIVEHCDEQDIPPSMHEQIITSCLLDRVLGLYDGDLGILPSNDKAYCLAYIQHVLAKQAFVDEKSLAQTPSLIDHSKKQYIDYWDILCVTVLRIDNKVSLFGQANQKLLSEYLNTSLVELNIHLNNIDNDQKALNYLYDLHMINAIESEQSIFPPLSGYPNAILPLWVFYISNRINISLMADNNHPLNHYISLFMNLNIGAVSIIENSLENWKKIADLLLASDDKIFLFNHHGVSV